MSTTSPTTVTATERRRQTRGVECMEIEKVYGHGNYGVVFKAVDSSTSKRPQVALKKIKMDRESQGFPITALREIKILNQMTHKNVVKLIEIVTCHSSEEEARNRGYKDKGILPGDVFMVFEFIDYDLAGLLKSKYQLNPTLIRSYAHQLLAGVKYLHENRILHRDLKCANILVTSNNVLKIADWGLARILPPQAHKLTVPVVTLWYRSPELILANRNYGAEIDIWSVGCIFMELFTRDPLFQGGKEHVQLDKIFSVLGCPEGSLLEKYKSYPDWATLNFQGFNYQSRVRDMYGSKLPNDHAYDLFLKLVDLDPATRITAKDALEHLYFKSEPVSDPERFPRIPIEPTTEHLENERKKRDAEEPKPAHAHHQASNHPGASHQQHHAGEQVEKAGYVTYNNVGHSRINHNVQKASDPKMTMFSIRKPTAPGGAQAQQSHTAPPAQAAESQNQSQVQRSNPTIPPPIPAQQHSTASTLDTSHKADHSQKAPAVASSSSNRAPPFHQNQPFNYTSAATEHGDGMPLPNVPNYSHNSNNDMPFRNPHHGQHRGGPGYSNPRQFNNGPDFNSQHRGPGRDFGTAGHNNNFNNNFPPSNQNFRDYNNNNNPRFSQYFPSASGNTGPAVVNVAPALNSSIPFHLQPEPHANQRSSTSGDDHSNGPDSKRSRNN